MNTMLQALMTESQTKNIEVTLEALKAFYQESAPDKLAEMDDKKLTDILDKAGKGGGPGHYGLVQALKKKYNGKAPKTRARIVAAKPTEQKTPPPSSKAKSEPAKPNLHLATVQELQAEMDKRREEEEEKKAESATDDDESTGSFPIYDQKNRTDDVEQVKMFRRKAQLGALNL